MDKISKRSRGAECCLRSVSLFFLDYVVLLASSSRDLKQALWWFADEFEAAGLRVSSKFEVKALRCKRLDFQLQTGCESLSLVEEFKYLWVLFTCGGRP